MVSIEVRSMTENKCWGDFDCIIKKNVDVWTLREHQGRLVSAS